MCNDWQMHVLSALIGGGLVALGLVIGSLKSCQLPDSQDEAKHRRELEKMELEYKLRNSNERS